MRFRFIMLLVLAAVVGSACGSQGQVASDSSPASVSSAVATEPTSSSAPATTSPVTASPVPSLPAPDATDSTTDTTTEPPATTIPSTEPPTSAPLPTGTTSVDVSRGLGGSPGDPAQTVRLRFESRVGDVTSAQLRDEALSILNDERGWPRAGFSFVADDASPMAVVLAEGAEVDRLCLPLVTYGSVSCQNGPTVALNADRWRTAVDHWDGAVADYRGYLVNHEVGHLLGQRHPKPRCPVAGRPAGVMEQQTAGFEGCVGNAWPRPWEIELASARPVVYAPLPDWGPEPVPTNAES